MGLWQLRPAELECAWYAFEAFDDVSFDEWVEFGGVAGEFIDDVVWRVEGFAEGVGVGGVVGVFVVVDELSYPLHGVVEHGPSLVWMVC